MDIRCGLCRALFRSDGGHVPSDYYAKIFNTWHLFADSEATSFCPSRVILKRAVFIYMMHYSATPLDAVPTNLETSSVLVRDVGNRDHLGVS
jgi:hypothetical protein